MTVGELRRILESYPDEEQVILFDTDQQLVNAGFRVTCGFTDGGDYVMFDSEVEHVDEEIPADQHVVFIAFG